MLLNCKNILLINFFIYNNLLEGMLCLESVANSISVQIVEANLDNNECHKNKFTHSLLK